MSDSRCELTELLVSACGCRMHRGGTAIEPDVVETVGQPFPAAYPGLCAACTGRIHVGQTIARLADGPGGYAHVGGCPS